MKISMKLGLTIFCVVLMTVFVLTALAIVIDGGHDRIHTSDVAIVFGNTVNPDGSASPRLEARLDKAIALYNKGVIPRIIVSGGTGKEGVDEALAMKFYLVANDIPFEAVIVDSNGYTTADTARNSASIMRQHGYQSALLVSQYFHITRARMALHQCGISKLYNAHPTYFEWRDIYSLAREVVGFYAYYFKQPC